MPNKAFAIDAQLRKSQMIDEHRVDELKRRGTHPCVLENIEHDNQRRQSSSRTSRREILGHAWRAEHGFGRPFHSGGSYRAKMAKDRADAAKRRAMRRQALKAKISGGIRKAIAGVKRIVRKAARGQ